jgi:hypothetical protein
MACGALVGVGDDIGHRFGGAKIELECKRFRQLHELACAMNPFAHPLKLGQVVVEFQAMTGGFGQFSHRKRLAIPERNDLSKRLSTNREQGPHMLFPDRETLRLSYRRPLSSALS